MSTPDKPIINPLYHAGDNYQCEDGPLLTRDSVGRWLTGWGLWVLSDQHLDADEL